MSGAEMTRATRRRSRPPETPMEGKAVQNEDFIPHAERPALRPSVEDDSRARARKHMEEIRRSGAEEAEGVDRFWAPQAPEFFEYEWKMKSVMQKEDAPYQMRMRHAGWKPVPRSRHPEMMPTGEFDVIERDGMILMERPKEYNDEVRNRERQKARDQVRNKQEQLSGTPHGTLDRTKAKLSTAFEPLRIPD